MNPIVIHVWTDIADPDSYLGLERLSNLAGVELEHHCLTRSLPPSEAALAEYEDRGLTWVETDTSAAHDLVYAAKALGTDPVDAARRGVAMARDLGEQSAQGADIADPTTLAAVAARHGVESWDDPTYRAQAETDREDGQRVHAEALPFVIIGGIIAAGGLNTQGEYDQMVGDAASALGITRRAAEEEVNRARPSGPAH